jgi:hypothetical protein
MVRILLFQRPGKVKASSGAIALYGEGEWAGVREGDCHTIRGVFLKGRFPKRPA